MQLSVVIVNYNVRHFLEQCLRSVFKATASLEAEVWVVDNNSADGSVEMVRWQFPQVKLLANADNPGFARANNQAIRQAAGKYILLLNPDTLVEEDTFTRCIEFMEAHPDAGGLGVCMIDGRGRFLPESKRALPTPAVAFYKMSGLSRLFPRSKRFGKYHLGYLDRNETHEVEVLSGAFMMMRRTALDKTGLLDEDYFMYGEDIDLSYRLIKQGYRNYYYPGTRIIHYKGESTSKSSVNYVLVFYNAMRIFAGKHFSGSNASLFNFIISLAIIFRASLAIAVRFLRLVMMPLLDAVLLYSGLTLLRLVWEGYVRADEGLHFQPEVQTIAFPLFILVWITSLALTGGYERPVKLSRILKGVLAGSAIILLAYGILPEALRFSRALVLLGSAWALLMLPLLRIVLNSLGLKAARLEQHREKRIAIVGGEEEYRRVSSLLQQALGKVNLAGRISLDDKDSPNSIGRIDRMKEIISLYKIDEVIFCAQDVPSTRIISHMSVQSESRVDFKIAPPESLYIIGSHSANTQGELYGIQLNSISRPSNRRTRRLFDVFTALFLLVTLPLQWLIIRNRTGLIRNIFRVLSGKATWVGYIDRGADSMLPPLREGVLTPADQFPGALTDHDIAVQLNQLYAKDYNWQNDLLLVLKCYRQLGRMRPKGVTVQQGKAKAVAGNAVPGRT